MMRGLAFLALLTLAGCGSPQTQYFTLQPVAGAPAARSLSGGKPPIVIRHVMLPATLDRLSIVSQGPRGELRISDRNRWAAPLDGMVQATLAADLAAELPGAVIIPGDPVPPGDKRALAVTIRSFVGNAQGQVILKADWFVLLNGAPVPGLQGHEAIEVDTPSAGVRDMVPGMSRALAVLSQHIGRAVRQKVTSA